MCRVGLALGSVVRGVCLGVVGCRSRGCGLVRRMCACPRRVWVGGVLWMGPFLGLFLWFPLIWGLDGGIKRVGRYIYILSLKLKVCRNCGERSGSFACYRAWARNRLLQVAWRVRLENQSSNGLLNIDAVFAKTRFDIFAHGSSWMHAVHLDDLYYSADRDIAKSCAVFTSSYLSKACSNLSHDESNTFSPHVRTYPLNWLLVKLSASSAPSQRV